MKKTFALLLTLCILFGVAGCVSTEAPQQNADPNQQNNVGQNTSGKEPTETVLTTENISDYLTISYDVHDVEKKNVGGALTAEGKLTIKTSPRKRGDFSNVVIQAKITCNSNGWEALGNWEPWTLEIPFDGKFEQIFKIWSTVVREGNYLTTTPPIKLSIVSVSGTFIEQ